MLAYCRVAPVCLMLALSHFLVGLLETPADG